MTDQTGAPKSAYVSRDFIQVHRSAIQILGSWEAAGVFQRIAWKCEKNGSWTASLAEIAKQCYISERSARRITKNLRDLGWIEAERMSTWDATLTWRVQWEQEIPDAANLAASGTRTEPGTAISSVSQTANLAATPSTRYSPPPSPTSTTVAASDRSSSGAQSKPWVDRLGYLHLPDGGYRYSEHPLTCLDCGQYVREGGILLGDRDSSGKWSGTCTHCWTARLDEGLDHSRVGRTNRLRTTQ